MKNQNKHYQQLTQEPRYQISALRKTGMSLISIALEVGVHFSTVSRELRRNVTANGYVPQVAHRLSDSRRRSAQKVNKRTDMTDAIIKQSLVLGWSPETICQRLRIEAKPLEHLSHTIIYRRIKEDRQQGGMLYRKLPRFGKKTLERRGSQQKSRGQIDTRHSRYL